MTLTKPDIVNELARMGHGTIFTRKESAALVESLLEISKQSLESREDVLMSGFGKFCVKDKRERRGRNPQIGQDLLVDQRTVVAFQCSGVLRDKINGRGRQAWYQ